MSKLLSPKVWYLVGIGAAALTVDAARRMVKRRRHAADGDGLVIEEALTEVTVTEAVVAPAESKPKRSRAKSTSKKQPAENIQSVVDEPIAITPVAVEVETGMDSPAPDVSSVIETVAGDDLTQIKGIGPTYARRLVAAGYDSYASIAGASADTLREITKAPAMADIEAWIDTARALSQ